MNQVDKKYIILGSLCALILMLAVGYAAFNTILNIKGTTSINSNWDVRITSIEKIASKGATDNEGSPSYDNTNGLSATFNTSFTTPGDYATYKIEITNNGSLDATLKTITMPENTNNDIIFYLNKNQNNEDITDVLKQNDMLFKKGETGNIGYVYVTVLYRDYENQKTPTKDEDKTASMTVTFEFEQAEESSSNTPVEPEPTPTIPDNYTGTVYRWGEDQLKIGNSINGIEGVTDAANIKQNVYLKHNVANGEITSIEVCFIMNNQTRCLTAGDSGASYETNKSTLIAAFNESNCDIMDSFRYNLIECRNTPFLATAQANGTSIIASYDDLSCNFYELSGSYCNGNSNP